MSETPRALKLIKAIIKLKLEPLKISIVVGCRKKFGEQAGLQIFSHRWGWTIFKKMPWSSFSPITGLFQNYFRVLHHQIRNAMETKKLLTIDPDPTSLEEYRQELITALLFALKRPFLAHNDLYGPDVTGFDEEETTAYYNLLDLLEKLLVNAEAIPKPVNPEG